MAIVKNGNYYNVIMWKTKERQSSIETNDTVPQDHVEIIKIYSTSEEDKSQEVISSISFTPPTNSANSDDGNSVEENFIRAYNLSFGRLGQQ